MELNPSETRIIIDALKFRLAYLNHEQSSLKDTEEDRITELSQDMYHLEILIQCLTDSYTQAIRKIENESRNYLNQKRQSASDFPILPRKDEKMTCNRLLT